MKTLPDNDLKQNRRGQPISSPDNSKVAPRYPHITVRLSEMDGNPFAILGMCRSAARAAGLSPREIEAFFSEATKGDYAHLIETVMRWFNCE